MAAAERPQEVIPGSRSRGVVFTRRGAAPHSFRPARSHHAPGRGARRDFVGAGFNVGAGFTPAPAKRRTRYCVSEVRIISTHENNLVLRSALLRASRRTATSET